MYVWIYENHVKDTVLCKSNANVIRQVSRIFGDNKRNYVWSDFSMIFLESYCLSDNDISLHSAKFERNYVALHDSSSEISWHSMTVRAKLCLSSLPKTNPINAAVA